MLVESAITVELAITVVTSIASVFSVGAASTAVYELIKRARKKGEEPERRQVHVERTRKEDGTEILVIDIDE